MIVAFSGILQDSHHLPSGAPDNWVPDIAFERLSIRPTALPFLAMYLKALVLSSLNENTADAINGNFSPLLTLTKTTDDWL